MTRTEIVEQFLRGKPLRYDIISQKTQRNTESSPQRELEGYDRPRHQLALLRVLPDDLPRTSTSPPSVPC